jgi:hypothetical protein
MVVLKWNLVVNVYHSYGLNLIVLEWRLFPTDNIPIRQLPVDVFKNNHFLSK